MSKFTANVVLADSTNLIDLSVRLFETGYLVEGYGSAMVVQGDAADLDTFLDTLEEHLPSDATIDDYGYAG